MDQYHRTFKTQYEKFVGWEHSIKYTNLASEVELICGISQVQRLPSFQALQPCRVLNLSQTQKEVLFLKKCIIKQVLNLVFAQYHELSNLVSELSNPAFASTDNLGPQFC